MINYNRTKKNDDFVYGIRAVIEAIRAGKTIEKIMFKNGLKGQIYNELFAIVKAKNIQYQFVPIERINKFTQKNHQGVIAFISPIEYVDIEQLTQCDFEQGHLPLYLILDKVTDVRNFGSIARTAECAGVNGIIIPNKGSAKINNDAIKTSAGALYNIPVSRVNDLKKTVKYLKNSGINVIAASEKSSKYYFNIDLSLPTAIIMGSEGIGIDQKLVTLCNSTVKIPIKGKIDSLNVSNATAVIVYEALRQRLMQL